MPDLHVNARLTIPEKEITTTAARSSGPGGQNVNKVNSKVTLRWSPANCDRLPDPWRGRFVARFGNRINRDGEVILHSEKYRDQPRNMADVRQKLVTMLMECQAPPKIRKKTRPSLGSKRRHKESKQRKSDKKQSRRQNFGRD